MTEQNRGLRVRILWKKLAKKGLPLNLVKTLQALFDHNECCISFNGNRSECHWVRVRVRPVRKITAIYMVGPRADKRAENIEGRSGPKARGIRDYKLMLKNCFQLDMEKILSIRVRVRG